MIRRLRILLFYDCIYPESVGGVEHRNHELARALAGRGHHVTLAGFCSARRQPFESVEIVPIAPAAPLYDAAGRRSVRQALRLARGAASLQLRDFDVVEAANIPYAHLWPLALRCHRLGKPLVVTWYEFLGGYWRNYLRSWSWPAFRAIELASVRLGSRLVASSEFTARRVRAHRGTAEVPVVPIGIPLQRIRQIANQSRGSGPPLVYAGRLLPEKRIDALLNAVVRLSPTPGPTLEIIGDGPDRDRLRALTARLGIESRVLWTGWLADSAEVWARLSLARVAVQPSSREGFGLFPLEAMAVGLPVVYCDSQENALGELVRHGREGLCAQQTPDALAAAISMLLDDSAQYTRLAGNALARAAQYDWPALAAQMEAVFEEAYQGRSGRARHVR